MMEAGAAVGAAVTAEVMPSAVEAAGAGQGTSGEAVEPEAAIPTTMAEGAGGEVVGQAAARRWLLNSFPLTTTPVVDRTTEEGEEAAKACSRPREWIERTSSEEEAEEGEASLTSRRPRADCGPLETAMGAGRRV